MSLVQRIGWIADLVIPVFTAAMALIDTTDGVLRLGVH